MTILTEDQKKVIKAVQRMYTSKESFLTIDGPAGVGKTYCMQQVLSKHTAFQETLKLINPSRINQEIIFTATTNKAVGELDKSIGSITRSSTTIHSALGLVVRKGRLVRTRNNESLRHTLGHQIVVIDEASMIDNALLEIIVDVAESCNTKFVFLGDSNQLPPVKSKDISRVFTTDNLIKMTEVVRQSGPLLAVVNSFRDYVETDVMPDIPIDGQYVQHMDQEMFEDAIRQDMMAEDWHNTDSRVVGYSNNSVKAYNDMIKHAITGTSAIKVGEQVLNNKSFSSNNGRTIPTDAMVYVKNIRRHRNFIWGNLFTVTYNNDDYHMWMPDNEEDLKIFHKAAKEGKMSERMLNMLGTLKPIYASTIHKAQGSTFKRIYIDLNSIRKAQYFDKELFKRLLYVAVSRASEQIIFTGDI
jgi:hypothetical protein